MDEEDGQGGGRGRGRGRGGRGQHLPPGWGRTTALAGAPSFAAVVAGATPSGAATTVPDAAGPAAADGGR